MEEKMVDIGEIAEDLPNECFGILESRPNDVVRIYKGNPEVEVVDPERLAGFKRQTGYRSNSGAVDALNCLNGTTIQQRAAMEHGLMYGFTTVGADPLRYDGKARFVPRTKEWMLTKEEVNDLKLMAIGYVTGFTENCPLEDWIEPQIAEFEVSGSPVKVSFRLDEVLGVVAEVVESGDTDSVCLELWRSNNDEV